MKLIKVKNYDEMSNILLEIFVEEIEKNPDAVLSFTTGRTPQSVVDLLAQKINEGLDITQTTMLNLDEYVGDPHGVWSVYTWMHKHLYHVIKTQPKNKFWIQADNNPCEEIKRYQKILEQYPRDIQLLGLGVNGHIGANEPGTAFDSTMFLADSKESTIQSTLELFNLTYEQTPRQMFTMGFKEIMAAKKVVLAASGLSKAKAVQGLLENPIDPSLPASILKSHPDFTLVVDIEALSLVKEWENL